MTQDIAEMRVFVAIVENLSLSEAARKLGLTPSAVSKSLSRLEARLGATLVHTSPRKIWITEIGAYYYEESKNILDDLCELDKKIRGYSSSSPGQTIKITSSIPFGRLLLSPLLAEFCRIHQHVNLDIYLDDTVVDLVEAQVDLAVRVGPLRDSTLIAQRLLDSPYIVVASPDYLHREGFPEKPTDLNNHDCIAYNFKRKTMSWPFQVEKKYIASYRHRLVFV